MAEDHEIPVTKGGAVYPGVAKAIAKLGRDISLARRNRRITAEAFAAQMGVSRMTLHRLETGDPGASLNTLGMAMHVLGRLNAIADVADPSTDDVGMMMVRQAAPTRVGRSRGFRAKAGAAGAPSPAAAPQAEPVTEENGFVSW